MEASRKGRKGRRISKGVASRAEALGAFFRKFDLYGQPIQLTYKGHGKYKTYIGATISLAITMILLSFISYKLYIMVGRQATNVKNTYQVLDLNLEEGFYPFQRGFDLAFGTGRELDPSLGYYSVNHVHYYYNESLRDDNGQPTRTKKRTPISFERCGSEGFNSSAIPLEQLERIKDYNCLGEKAHQLLGDYYAGVFDYIEIKLYKCMNDSFSQPCQPQEVIDDYLGNSQFKWAFSNAYLDHDNYESPIKYFLDDSFFFELENQRMKLANMYVMRTQISLQDHFLQLGQRVLIDSFEVQNFRTYDDDIEDDQRLAAVYIRQDRTFLVNSRQIYGLLQLLGDIGGLQRSLVMIGMVFVSFVQKKLYVANLISSFYQVKKEEEKKENKDCVANGQSQSPFYASFANDRLIRPSNFESALGYQTESNNHIKVKETSRRTKKSLFASSLQNKKSSDRYVRGVDQQFEINDIQTGPFENIMERREPTGRNGVRLPKIEQLGPEQEQKEQQCLDVSRKEEPALSLRSNYSANASQYLPNKIIDDVTTAIISRERISFTRKDLIQHMCLCLCCRNVKKKPGLKKHQHFKKSQKKLKQELDVVTLLKSIRHLRLISQALFTSRNRLLLQFQKQSLIETSSSSSDSDTNTNGYDTMNLMEHKNPVVRLMIYGKIKRLVNSFKGDKLQSKELNLVKGIFQNKLKDLENDFRDKLENKTLLQRLRGEMHLNYQGNSPHHGEYHPNQNT